MPPLYIGNQKVDACYLGSNKIDKGMLGADEVCGGPVYARFDMLVTAPAPPTTYTVEGGSLTIKDNGDGTYRVSSDDRITKFRSSYRNKETVVVVNRAADLVDIKYAWKRARFQRMKLVSFDASGLTEVTNADSAWSSCEYLTSFINASALTSVTNIDSAWAFGEMTSFDASALTSVTSAKSAWWRNLRLLCFNRIDSTRIINKANMFVDSRALIAPNATEQGRLLSSAGYNYINPNPCP